MLIFVTEHKEKHRYLLDRLFENAVYLFVCSYENAAFYCDRKDTGGVILDAVSELPRAEHLCRELHASYPEMPIAAIVSKNAIPDLSVSSLLRDTDPISLTAALLRFCSACGWNTRTLSTYALLMSADPRATGYMGYRLPLSPREHDILRCLLYRAPRLTSIDDLMSLCFRGGRQKAENIPVHISNINKRAARIDPRPLIVNVYGKGYRLRDGIL